MNPCTQAPSANDNYDEKSTFKRAMAGNWKDLVTDFKMPHFEQDKKITKAGDTILHMAVNSGNKSDTKKFVDGVRRVEVLRATNKEKNTPLHLAAAQGYNDLCKYMIEAEKKIIHADDKEVRLIKSRNGVGETPFFTSVFYGRREVFEYFLGIILREHPAEDERRELCRRKDGDTVLHCSIAHEFFDLALAIAHYFPFLTNAHNEKGLTPLQVLANHPSVFKSGSRLKRTDNLIYFCTWVDPLVVGSLHKEFKRDNIDDTKNLFLPKNYEILEKFFRGITRFFSKNDRQKHQQNDLNELTSTHIPIDSQGAKLELQELGIGSGISQYFPPNYTSLVYIIKYLCLIAMIPLGLDFGRFQRIKSQKEKHIWAAQVMKALIKNESDYEYENTGVVPTPPEYIDVDSALNSMAIEEPQLKQSIEGQEKNGMQKKKEVTDSKETPILTAAKLGIVEMVEEIEKTFPVAIHDTNRKKKNIVHLAVKNRQLLVYEYLLKKYKMSGRIFQEVDNNGNSAIHLAAKANYRQHWSVPGAALQMQWEIKWFKYIEDSYYPKYFFGVNRRGETPNDVFSRTHKYLIKEGREWLTNTSQSCTVVAALIATVAFSSSATVPGGVHEKSGFPVLENELPFKIFTAASLVAFCLSVTSLIMFLAILTSRFGEKDFHRDLPLKLIIGLTSLYFSLAATFVAFCAGHSFVLQEKLKTLAFPIYGITCLPISFFAYALFPLYVDLFRCTFSKVPLRTYKEFPSS